MLSKICHLWRLARVIPPSRCTTRSSILRKQWRLFATFRRMGEAERTCPSTFGYRVTSDLLVTEPRAFMAECDGTRRLQQLQRVPIPRVVGGSSTQSKTGG